MSAAAALDLLDQLIRGWRAYALIALIALASALPGVGRLPVLDRDEARFAQATRQMLQSGDYVRIRLQEDARNKKPIGIHWMQAAAANLTQPLTQRDNAIWAYRLPSVLGALMAALACLWGGVALMSRPAAFMGAALFAASMLMSAEGMIAKTDGALAGFTTLALAAMARLYSGGARPKALGLLFWAAMGAAMLIKGPVAPLVALLTLVTLGLWEGRWAWMRPLLWWPGPILAAAMVAPWMIAIGLATNGAFFAEAIGEDLAPKLSGGAEGHFAWPGYHLALLPLLIFPATFALPAALRLGWRTLRTPRAQAAPLRFIIAWAVPCFVVFELAPTKLAHYVLPAYPAIALLCGAALEAAASERQKLTRLAGVVLFTLAALVLIGLVGWAATYMPGDAEAGFRRAAQAALGGGALLLAAIAAMMFAPRPIIQTGVAALLALSLSFTLRERILPEARTLHVSVETEAGLRRARLLPDGVHGLYVIGYGEMSLVFLTRTDIHIGDAAEIASQVSPGDTLVIEERRMGEAAAALSARDLAFEAVGAPVEGHNYGNGHSVRLNIGRVEPITQLVD